MVRQSTGGFLRPLIPRHGRMSSFQSLFSTTVSARAESPLTDIIDSIHPTRATRYSQASVPSRQRPNAGTSSAFTRSDIPSASGPVRRPSSQFLRETQNRSISDAGSKILVETLERNLPPTTQAQQNSDKRHHQQHVRQIEAQASRNWRDGDVYSPHDLSPVEMQKARQARLPARSNNLPSANTRKKGGKDVLDDLGVDPLKEYKNFAMMSEFMTEMGRIRHSRDTGLRAVNQRRMAKAVRRAIGIGIMPSVHRHPELMEERRTGRAPGKGR